MHPEGQLHKPMDFPLDERVVWPLAPQSQPDPASELFACLKPRSTFWPGNAFI